MNTEQTRLTITYVPLDKLTHAEYNPRKLTQDRFEDLQRSLDELDILEPLIVNRRDGKLIIVSGNQRYEAMRALGMDEAPCNIISVPLAREKTINVRMNKSSGFDDDTLLAELLMSQEELERELSGWGDEEILKLQDGFVDHDALDADRDKPEKVKPKTYSKEELRDYAKNYPNAVAAAAFVEWLP